MGMRLDDFEEIEEEMDDGWHLAATMVAEGMVETIVVLNYAALHRILGMF
jgi:hypothetical protein